MRRIIVFAIIFLFLLLVVGLGIGVPFVKYKSLDKVVTFWSETLGGTSSFNPGKGWQDLTKTGGDIQAEARKVPAVQPATDLGKDVIGGIVQFFKDAIVNGYNFKLAGLPFVDKTFLKDYTFGSLLTTFLGVLILALVAGWGTHKATPKGVKDAVGLGTQNVWSGAKNTWTEFRIHQWEYLVRCFGLIGFIILIASIWNSGKQDAVVEIIKVSVGSFLAVLCGEAVFVGTEKGLAEIRLEGFIWPYRILVLIGVFFTILGIASGQPMFLNKLGALIKPVPLLGEIFQYTLEQFAILVKTDHFAVGLVLSTCLIFDSVLAKRAKRSS